MDPFDVDVLLNMVAIKLLRNEIKIIQEQIDDLENQTDIEDTNGETESETDSETDSNTKEVCNVT